MPYSGDERFLAKLATALQTTKLDAIVVGNMASILNDAPVLTQDVDLLVRDTKLNRKKLRQLAEELGGVGPERLSGLTATEHIYGADLPIDILYEEMSGGLKFASVKTRAHLQVVGKKGELLMVASLADIIKSKTVANRPKDRAVLPILRDTLAARRAAGREPPEKAK
jgi:hypothetical protein